MSATIPTRPLLRYHGGKFILAPWIIGHFPHHKVYVEPFGGAASVLMRKPRSYAEVYNELDGEVVNLFRMVRDRGPELFREIELTPFSREEFVESWQQSSDPMESARRMIVRSFMGFSSVGATMRGKNHGTPAITGFRANVTRSGSTPATDWRGYPECLVAIIERLRGVVIENRPAIQVMTTHDGPETLHYVDPPYVPETRDGGGDYRHEMSLDDHTELALVLRGLQGMVILSGYPSELYESLYEGWQRVERDTFADGARSRVEVLWINPAAQRNLNKSGLFSGE